MTKAKKRIMKHEAEIIQAIEKNKEIRITDLAKLLCMWDGNLRKMINALVQEHKIERFIKDNYIYVKIKTEDNDLQKKIN